jgi:GNAT superfamily N-acetyltransferase
MEDLLAFLQSAAMGRFPPQDNLTTVMDAPAGATAAILSFPSHHVVAAGVPEDEVHEQLRADDLNGPMRPAFVAWLAERLGVAAGSVDVVLANAGGVAAGQLTETQDTIHPRITRARTHRTEVRVFEDARGLVTLGRGLAGRLELSFEVHPHERERGAARALLSAALATARPAEPVFAQSAAANAASLRALLAAGFKPIGAEVLFDELPE